MALVNLEIFGYRIEVALGKIDNDNDTLFRCFLL